jgi:hypothetical protein
MTRRTIVLCSILLLALGCNFSLEMPELGGTTIVILPTATSTATITLSPTPKATPTETRPFIVEQTLYEGERNYTCDPGGCWRDDGEVIDKPEFFYPGVEEDNPEIRALLDSFGLPEDIAADDAERWRRVRAVWEWMYRHTVVINTPEAEEPWNYLHELTSQGPVEDWPALGEMAKVFARYGVVPLGACNSKAFTIATFLYRFGVRPNAITVAHSRSANGKQHLYLALRLDGRWLYVDPTCIRSTPELDPQPHSIGCTSADYRHPYQLEPLPGSSFPKPMLLE